MGPVPGIPRGELVSLCEWNPDEGRAADGTEKPHGKATTVVGARGQWHLCAECAALPEFRRFRVRRPVHDVAAAELERRYEASRRRRKRRRR